MFIKSTCLFSLAIFSFLCSNAQTATQSNVEYQKGHKVAAAIELPYSADIVEGAIHQFFSARAKEDKYKGFTVYKNFRIRAEDPELTDLHFNVDKKAGDKRSSIVYLIIGRPGENIAMRTPEDNYKTTDGMDLLNTLLPIVKVFDMEQDLARQEEALKKAEKKMRSLEDDAHDLERSSKNLQDKIEANKKQLDAQLLEVEKQKNLLSNTRAIYIEAKNALTR